MTLLDRINELVPVLVKSEEEQQKSEGIPAAIIYCYRDDLMVGYTWCRNDAESLVKVGYATVYGFRTHQWAMKFEMVSKNTDVNPATGGAWEEGDAEVIMTQYPELNQGHEVVRVLTIAAADHDGNGVVEAIPYVVTPDKRVEWNPRDLTEDELGHIEGELKRVFEVIVKESAIYQIPGKEELTEDQLVDLEAKMDFQFLKAFRTAGLAGGGTVTAAGSDRRRGEAVKKYFSEFAEANPDLKDSIFLKVLSDEE